jgi:hypothetical protein
MIKQFNCKNCGAPLNLSLNRCEYCSSSFIVHTFAYYQSVAERQAEIINLQDNQTTLDKMLRSLLDTSLYFHGYSIKR